MRQAAIEFSMYKVFTALGYSQGHYLERPAGTFVPIRLEIPFLLEDSTRPPVDLPVLPPVLDAVSEHLDLGTRRALRQVSKLFRVNMPTVENVATLRLRRALLNYFSDPASFSTLLHWTASLISGSFILSIVCPSNSWAPQDLDIAVSKGSEEPVAE